MKRLLSCIFGFSVLAATSTAMSQPAPANRFARMTVAQRAADLKAACANLREPAIPGWGNRAAAIRDMDYFALEFARGWSLRSDIEYSLAHATRNPREVGPNHEYFDCMLRRRLVQIEDVTGPPAAVRTGPRENAPAAASQPASVGPNGVAAQPGAASNPAAEANQCIQIIGQADYAAMGVSSNFRAVFRNTCVFPVEIVWCVSGSDCNPGYSNLATILAGSTRGITHTGPEPQGLSAHVEFAACRNGFAPNQGVLSRQLLHACR
jgi:hypothetical protein